MPQKCACLRTPRRRSRRPPPARRSWTTTWTKMFRRRLSQAGRRSACGGRRTWGSMTRRSAARLRLGSRERRCRARKSMTTGEAIAEIRRIGRTCRGPKLLTAEQQRPLLAQLATDLPGLIPRIASYRRMLRLAPEFREELAAETLENAQAQETAVPTIHAQTQ